jgi:hypothetical protein
MSGPNPERLCIESGTPSARCHWRLLRARISLLTTAPLALKTVRLKLAARFCADGKLVAQEPL